MMNLIHQNLYGCDWSEYIAILLLIEGNGANQLPFGRLRSGYIAVQSTCSTSIFFQYHFKSESSNHFLFLESLALSIQFSFSSADTSKSRDHKPRRASSLFVLAVVEALTGETRGDILQNEIRSEAIAKYLTILLIQIIEQ